MFDSLIGFFGTRDLHATDHFYSQVLGLPLEKDQGTCRIYRVTEGGMLGFCRHIEPTGTPRSPIITLVTDDVDGIYQRLVAAGVEVPHPPAVNPKFSIYHFFITDPNGYTVEVQRFLE